MQFAELKKLVEDDIGDNIVAQHVNHAGTLFVGLVANVGNADNLAVFDKLGLTLDHLALVDTVGDGVGDDDVAAFIVHIDGGVGTKHHTATACGVSVAHPVVAVDSATAGKIGSFDILHQFLDCNIIIINESNATVEDFAQVVGGHVGGHTHSDTVRAVDKKVWYPGRENGGFFALIGIGGHHVNSVLFNIGHHFVGDLLHAALGVTHGGRAVAVDRAEVTLAVDHGVTHVPRLGHANHGEVDG